MIPKRRRPKRMNTRQSERIRCAGHLQWIRGHECLVKFPHFCDATQAAHVRTGTDGGTGLKPGDNWTIPLCQKHHEIQHRMGEASFEREYAIDMKAIAAKLWEISPHGKRYRREMEMAG